MRRGAVAVGLSVLFIAGAAACGSEEPKPGGFSLSPEPSVSSSSTSAVPSPTSTKDADGDYVLPGGGYDVLANMPPEAKERSRKGVMAFTKYYIHALSKLQMKPAGGQIELLASPACETCKVHEEGAKAKVQQGSRFDAMIFEQVAPGLPEPDPDSNRVDRVHQGSMIVVHQVHLLDKTGKAIRTFDVGTGKLLVSADVLWAGDGWRMAFFEGNEAS